ncbi:DUF3096 domain-containing protein [Candidatus Pacearchaeota archaeon]|nr:DUF3096 domain-containing protein [Candidatus Pacearchaeota archaeon]
MPKKTNNSNSTNTQDLTSVLSIIVGLIILIWPNILAITVGLFLLITGILDLYRRNHSA